MTTTSNMPRSQDGGHAPRWVPAVLAVLALALAGASQAPLHALPVDEVAPVGEKAEPASPTLDLVDRLSGGRVSVDDDEDEREPQEDAPAETSESDPDDVADPASLHVAAIGVQEELHPVGLEPNGDMEVPDFGDAGWYEPGSRPGEPGGAVLVGHVDSVNGPDVFYRLGELRPGDEVRVRHDDGRLGVWRVTEVDRTPKDDLPQHRLWPDTDEPKLALVTCGGEFDHSTGHYRDNVIAYTEWVGWDG